MQTQPRGIVVGYDGSPHSETALDWAATAAARGWGTPLTVLHVIDLPAAPVEPAYSVDLLPLELTEASETIVAEGLKRAAERLDPGQVSGVRLVGSPGAELVEASRSADLVVTGHRGRGKLAAGLLGSVSYTVTAHAACPAVVVRGDNPALPDPERPVVVGVDDSAGADRALDLAAEVAASSGARLHIVRVAHLISAESFAYVESLKAGSQQSHTVREEAEATLARAQERVHAAYPGLDIDTEVLYGEAGHALAPLGEHAALIVVGSRGRGGFAGLLLGSVSHTVIHEAACPVMVVRA